MLKLSIEIEMDFFFRWVVNVTQWAWILNITHNVSNIVTMLVASCWNRTSHSLNGTCTYKGHAIVWMGMLCIGRWRKCACVAFHKCNRNSRTTFGNWYVRARLLYIYYMQKWLCACVSIIISYHRKIVFSLFLLLSCSLTYSAHIGVYVIDFGTVGLVLCVRCVEQINFAHLYITRKKKHFVTQITFSQCETNIISVNTHSQMVCAVYCCCFLFHSCSLKFAWKTVHRNADCGKDRRNKDYDNSKRWVNEYSWEREKKGQQRRRRSRRGLRQARTKVKTIKQAENGKIRHIHIWLRDQRATKEERYKKQQQKKKNIFIIQENKRKKNKPNQQITNYE